MPDGTLAIALRQVFRINYYLTKFSKYKQNTSRLYLESQEPQKRASPRSSAQRNSQSANFQRVASCNVAGRGCEGAAPTRGSINVATAYFISPLKNFLLGGALCLLFETPACTQLHALPPGPNMYMFDKCVTGKGALSEHEHARLTTLRALTGCNRVIRLKTSAST